MYIRRGDLLIDVDFRGSVGSEQGGIRPCVVVSNNKCNRYSPVITVVPITTSPTKADIPTHLSLDTDKYKLKKPSTVLVEQVTSIDKSRIKERSYVRLDSGDMAEIDRLLKIQMGIDQE